MSAAENEKAPDVIAVMAAMIDGERWLCADAGAAYLGQMPRKTFLQHAADTSHPIPFPKPARLGRRTVWRKSELDDWAEQMRQWQQRHKAA